MGQYHYTVNLDKREFLNPYKLGDGLKLYEQINSPGGVPSALFILLACSNGRGGGDFNFDTYEFVGEKCYRMPREGCEDLLELATRWVGHWAGDRVAVVGDYAELDDLRPGDDADVIYDLCHPETERKECIAHYRKVAAEAREKGGQLYGRSVEKYEDKADRLEKAKPFTDITDDILPLVEAICEVEITGDGWRDKKTKGTAPRMCPDMVVTVQR